MYNWTKMRRHITLSALRTDGRTKKGVTWNISAGFSTANFPPVQPIHEKNNLANSWLVLLKIRHLVSYWLSLQLSRRDESARLEQMQPLCRIHSVSIRKGSKSLFNIQTVASSARVRRLTGNCIDTSNNIQWEKWHSFFSNFASSTHNGLKRSTQNILDCGHFKPGDRQLLFFNFSVQKIDQRMKKIVIFWLKKLDL